MGGHFDISKLKGEVNSLEEKMSDVNIWDNVNVANEVNKELTTKKKLLSEYESIFNDINSALDLISLLKEESDDGLLNSIESDYSRIKDSLKNLEINTLLDGEFDNNNCYLEIHPGAGGTESCDWASMLLRMYTMFFDKFGFKYSIIDKLPGEEAGIKSVLVYVTGDHPYGYLKSEIGVHRLVRISPFNAAGKRQTSFAAVNVTPEFDKLDDVEIHDNDIRIDVYRSSGNGGQGVNTTDSAVRITHIPSGIVVSVQNERSQIKNKEIAMNILKSKLHKIEVEKRNKEINDLKGSANIDFGSQIRNYVLEPYSMVKDVRTNYEVNNHEKVLDGDIYPFIEAYLRMKR